MVGFAEAFFTTPALSLAMGDAALLGHMAGFEAALAQAQGACGLIPAGAARVIAQVARDMRCDEAALFSAAAVAGTLAIPFVKQLTADVRKLDPSAAGFVHLGATSQDVFDTAVMLQMRDALALADADARRLGNALAALALAHRETPMLGRTLLQPATPITFGLKAAQWLAGIADARDGLGHSAKAAMRLQLGGAAGNLGSMGDKGVSVARAMSAALFPEGISFDPLPTHARRATVAALGASLAILTGACAKIARDVTLMMQFEVAEAFEGAGEGRGGSSAMPHKQNPVRSMQILANAARAPHLAATLIAALPQEHERGVGGWQAEWAVLPELARISGGSVALAADLIETLRVDAPRMFRNFDALRGLPLTEIVSLALAKTLGRDGAHEIVEAAARKVAGSDLTLADVLRGEPAVAARLSPGDIVALTDPAAAFGSAHAMVDAALARWRSIC